MISTYLSYIDNIGFIEYYKKSPIYKLIPGWEGAGLQNQIGLTCRDFKTQQKRIKNDFKYSGKKISLFLSIGLLYNLPDLLINNKTNGITLDN